MTTLLQPYANEHSVLIIGDPKVDKSGVMYETALLQRGVVAVWSSMADLFDQATDGNGVSMRVRVAENPYAIDVSPDDFSFVVDAPIRSGFTCAIVVSNDAEPYLPVLCRLLDAIGLRQLNDERGVAASQDKWETHVLLRDAGLPVPRAVLVHSRPEARFAAAALAFPLVVKELKGTQGAGVRLARDESELDIAMNELDLDRQPLMLEHYIECGSTDKRLIIVEHRLVNAMRRQAMEGEFRANTALGGTISRCELTQLEIELAQRASEVLGLRLAGIDMSVVTSTGTGREYLAVGDPFIIEANPAPSMDGPYRATGINGAENVVAMLLQ